MIISNRSALLEAVRKGVLEGSLLDLHFPEGNGLVPVQGRDLARLLRHTTGLEVLRMRHVDLQGDLRGFLRALSSQTKLRSFQAEFCNFSYRIAMVLSQLPALETLNIVGHKGFRWRRPMPVKMMTQLVQKGRIRDLRLDTLLHFSQQCARAFFRAVSESSLQVFWCLAANFGNTEVAYVAKLLQESSSLRDIRFSIAADVTNVNLIAEALSTNQSLTNLGIRLAGEQDPTPQDIKSFLDLLHENNNYTLQDLILARSTQWDADQRRHIPVYTCEESAAVYNKVEFYLSLNRSGRGELLLDTTTPEDWLAAIASQWDLSLLFYFTRMNPSLLLGGIPPPSDATRAHDQAVLLRRCSTLFPDAIKNGTLNLLGPRQAQDALMCLPESVPIQDLSVRFTGSSTTLCWKDLAALIRRSDHNIQTILLEGVTLQGPHQASFLEALSNSTTNLVHLSIRNCSCHGLDAERLAHVMSNLPSFESLGWTGNKEASLSFTGVNQLLRNRPMKFLALDQVVVPSEGEGCLEEFFRLIEQSTCLKVLRCETHPQGVSTCHLQQLAQSLATNRSLENLQIHVTSNVDLTPLAESLRSNPTLTGLHITGLDSIPNLSSFVSALDTSNSSLKSFLIGKHDLSSIDEGSRHASSESVQQIGMLLRANIARSRPPPLHKPCFNPA